MGGGLDHGERRQQRILARRLRAQQSLLDQLDEWLETPMLVLAFVWLLLFVLEVLWGLTPGLRYAGYAIWLLFLLEYLVELAVAPDRRQYITHNLLKALALAAPALRAVRVLRLLRVARAASAARGARLLRVVSSVNRGLRALRSSMGRRGLGYVLASSLLVWIVGAAGMYVFEGEAASGPGLADFGTALWWTAMIMVTLGSEYWPQTAEGRVLCLLIALYGFAVFGYITASLASFFIGRDAGSAQGELAGDASIRALRREIAALRAEIAGLRDAQEDHRR